MRAFFYVTGIIVCIILVALIWLTKPYMDYQSVRISDSTVTIDVEYQNVTGDPLCSKLYEKVEGEISSNAVIPNMPDDIPDPHEVEALKDGDHLTIEGYRYRWTTTNLLTGSIEGRSIGMIDVVAWKGPHGLQFESKQRDAPADKFNRKNYTNCK